MTSVRFVALFSLLTLFLASACGENETKSDSLPEQIITIDDESMALTRGYRQPPMKLRSTTNQTFSYRHIIILTGPGLSVTNKIPGFEGKGNVVMIEILTSTESLENGIYTFGSLSDDFLLVHTMFAINYKVKKEGNNYSALSKSVFMPTQGLIEISGTAAEPIIRFEFTEFQRQSGSDPERESVTGIIEGSFQATLKTVTIGG